MTWPRTWFETSFKPLDSGETADSTDPPGASPESSGSDALTGLQPTSLTTGAGVAEPLDSSGSAGLWGPSPVEGAAFGARVSGPDFHPSQQQTVVQSLDTLIVTLGRFVDGRHPMPVSFVSDLRSILEEVRDIAAKRRARHLRAIK